jgi:hypothetical protein
MANLLGINPKRRGKNWLLSSSKAEFSKTVLV